MNQSVARTVSVRRIHGWMRHWYSSTPGSDSTDVSVVGGLPGKPTGNTSVLFGPGAKVAHSAGVGSFSNFAKKGATWGTQLLTNPVSVTSVNVWISPPTFAAMSVVPAFTLASRGWNRQPTALRAGSTSEIGRAS